MIIVVGNGPDFLMRQGLVEVFHRSAVRAVDSGGVEKFHESTSDRSLWVVAKVVAEYLRAAGVCVAEVLRIDFSNFEAKFGSAGREVVVRIKLPHELDRGVREYLEVKFADFVKDFLKNSETRKIDV